MKPQHVLVSLVLFLLPVRAEADDADPPMGKTERLANRLEAGQAGYKRSPFELSAQLGARVEGGGLRDVTAMLFAVLPLDRFAAGRLKKVAPSPTPDPEVPDVARGEAPAPPAVLSPDDVRALVDAVVKHAGLPREEKRLDDLSSRARAAAALPELRIRVARITDESQSLAPTEYDPLRVTADARSTLWLEARATWRLDRLVFADEEVPLERLRRDVGAERLRLTERVTALVGAWQKATVEELRDDTTDVERMNAVLRVVECRTALDALSGGWISARAKKGE